MSIIIETALEETILEDCEITEVKILEVDTGGIIVKTNLEEIEVSLGKDNIQIILAEMTDIVLVGQDQVQELVLIETELDALNVVHMIMIILLKTVKIHKQKRTRTDATNV